MDCTLVMLESDLRHAMVDQEYREKLLDDRTFEVWLEGNCHRMAVLLNPLERGLFICAMSQVLRLGDHGQYRTETYAAMLQHLCMRYAIEDELLHRKDAWGCRRRHTSELED